MGLEEKIASKQAKIGVVGLGYVGLPLAVEFAQHGFQVHGIDVNAGTVEALNQGVSHILDVKSEKLKKLVDAGCFKAHSSFDIVSELDCISLCVPTPLRKTKDPDISFILSATQSIRRHIHPGMLIVLESTTYPGTTEEVLIPELCSDGYRVGEDIFVSFSPERVDPGNPVYNTRNTPKIVGGSTPRCTELTIMLYQQVIETVIPVSSTAAAEMVKLLENTFRAVNIGLVNELAIMCDRLKLPVWEVIEAASTKPFGFMPFYPGPGLGGHCIPIDPLYLSWKLKLLNYNARFIELASEVNASMPEYCVHQVARLLNRHRKCVNGARILILGVAYKRDVSDTRESPALDIIRLLELDGASVDYSDPHVPRLESDDTVANSVALSPETIAGYDLVILATDHSWWDYSMIQKSAALIFDTRNAFKGSFENVAKL